MPYNILMIFFMSFNKCIKRIKFFCQNVHFLYPTPVTGKLISFQKAKNHTYIPSIKIPENPLIYWAFLDSRQTVSTCSERWFLYYIAIINPYPILINISIVSIRRISYWYNCLYINNFMALFFTINSFTLVDLFIYFS